MKSNRGVHDSTQGNEQLSSFAWTLTATIALFPIFVQLGVMASLLAGRVGLRGVFPAAALASMLAGNRLLRRQGFAVTAQCQAAIIFLFLLIASLVLSGFFFDFSWDGQWYHQTAIIHIAQDWNPLTDPMHNFAPNVETWDRHYAKGPWYFAAAVYQTTGHIEWGKAINWLALAASFLGVFAACVNGGMHRINALAIAFVVAVNPVVMSEVTTYLVDAVMISFLVVAVSALLACFHRHSVPALVAGVAGAIACTNAKFTGLVYLCFALAAGAIWCTLRQRKWLLKYVSITAAALFLAACVWGFNPYVTNTYYRAQPFYPMLGSSKYPSLEQSNRDGNEKYETPKNMVGRSLPVRFGYSIFGRPGNQPYEKGKNASLMWPFSATSPDLYAYKYHETRVAGFGPFFSGCLILAFLLGLLLIFNERAARWSLVLIAATVILSLGLSRHLWWPRYGPQLWLLPILPLAFAFQQRVSGYKLVLTRVVLFLLIADAAIVSWVRLKWETNASITLRQQLKQMRESGQVYDVQTNYFDDSWRIRLLEAGVKFQDVGMKKLPGSQELMSVVEGYPLAIHYRPASGSDSKETESR